MTKSGRRSKKHSDTTYSAIKKINNETNRLKTLENKDTKIDY